MNEEKRALNRQTSMVEYNCCATRLVARPRIVFIELTQDCNLRCPMCRDRSSNYQSHRMSEDLFEKIVNELFQFTEMVDLRGWGESMILDDFPAKVSAVIAAGCEFRVMSNLSFRRPRNIHALAKANAFLGISLDAADERVLTKARTGANLDLITENIKTLRQAYKENSSDFSRVYISATIQPAVIGQLCSLVDFACRYRIKQIRLFPGMGNNEHLIRNKDDILRLVFDIEAAFALADRSSVDLWIGAKLWDEMEVDVPHFKQPCIHPWAYCFINWKGDVGFCDYLMGPGCEVHFIGNLVKSSFDTIWNGLEMIDVRKRHIAGGTNEFKKTWRCEWCYQNRFVDFEDRFANWYHLRRVRRNSLR